MMNPQGPRQRQLRIGVLDNDCCALECIVAMIAHLNNRAGRRLEVWSSDNPAKAMQHCRFGTHPTDVMFIDMALNGLTGAQVAMEIRKHAPGIAIIGITSYAPELYAEDMRAAGAQALLDKSTLKHSLAEALDAVSQGLPYPADSGFPSIRNAYATLALDESSAASVHLTATEQQIITLSLSHMSTKEIATELSISADTVFSHRRNIKKKFHASTWYDAVDRCRELHIA
ncbi:MAG: response regulator transcription factor [Bifidobacterium subtile]|jgi:DNA-binding NarL/FixJ family response regulator|nr:response regulator transcription factor [Bifidobacterium subtile]MCI1258950.1 response regulator transcription factor [Bifidobacterium subtile]